jgi:hypothetical protein
MNQQDVIDFLKDRRDAGELPSELTDDQIIRLSVSIDMWLESAEQQRDC